MPAPADSSTSTSGPSSIFCLFNLVVNPKLKPTLYYLSFNEIQIELPFSDYSSLPNFLKMFR